ncbi:hypothetical protein P9990_27010 (plasmid) [Prescottella equi]|uniref:hypothetical protein n=1 Tax=Rhodococcus hoagii TaxID=43767 RepID=UPI0025750262|nr:hypothetical protein [Prescottella equi]WJJ14695.1 hypothetical protein P9990_27010 [Prescottella equi]
MSDEWGTAAEAVAELGKQRSVAEMSASDLREWASQTKVMTRTLWPKVKRELYKQFDVDYEEAREAETAARTAALKAAAESAPIAELFAAGDGRGSFAIVGVENTSDVCWYGTFHPEDKVYKADDQDSADEAASGKAVFLASKVRESLKADALRLRLHVSSERINGVKLADLAAKKQIILELDVMARGNPAEDWTQEPGYSYWQSIRLSDLVVEE